MKAEEGEVMSGVAGLHNFSQREQKKSEGKLEKKEGRERRRRESCIFAQGNLARPVSFFPSSFSSSNLIFPIRLMEDRQTGQSLVISYRSAEEEARSRAALWNSWVDPVVTQGGNKGRTRRLTHALSAGACTHLHTDLQW